MLASITDLGQPTLMVVSLIFVDPERERASHVRQVQTVGS
jgi:hypothetical protein